MPTSADADRRLDTGYAAARRRFIQAASDAGASLRSHPHPATGLEGEELAIDVATSGDRDARDVVCVVSGTHGVEGYAGSALQSWWLDTHGRRGNGSVRMVFVHALNPVGFSWVRRVNEDNVDLNRNFVDWSQPPPRNEGYGEIAELLVPARWDVDTQAETTDALVAGAAATGMEAFQQTVSGGQYEHPTGLFYGGAGPVWSHRWLAEHLADVVAPCDRLAVIDLHTGLGPWGFGELISSEQTDTEAFRRSTAWWGDVRSMASGDSVSATLSGDWLTAIERFVPDAEVTSIAIEYGTVDMISVLQALRADAWLHAHDDPTGPDAAAIRAQLRAAFADDDPAWLARLIDRFDEVVGTAVERLHRADDHG